MKFSLHRVVVGIGMAVALGGCTTASEPEPEPAGPDLGQLAHHRWVLKTVDGEPVAGNRLGAYGKGLVPELDFGAAPHVAGFAGCNRYKGQAELAADGRFRVRQLASTMMMCPDAAMALERRYTDLLGEWSQLRLEGKQLLLQRGQERWAFELFDWVQ